MNAIAKSLVANKEWLVKVNEQKIGAISKQKKGILFIKNGNAVRFNNLSELEKTFNISFEDPVTFSSVAVANGYSIYEYPCNVEPFNPVYNVRKKLPLYTKNSSSKCQFCAGYYLIKFKKKWLKSFCPKLITLERNPYYGPYKTDLEAKTFLSHLIKDETT